MTAREPFAKLVLERDRSYFIYAEGELLDFTTSQDSAEERCERLNLAFEKAVAKREAVRSDWPCAAGFKAGLERAARIIIENEERRTTSTHKAYLGPRDPGNVSGMGFVETIRAEIEKI